MDKDIPQVRLFRGLVRALFPADFRAGYEAEMTRTFRAQHREAGAAGGVARLWWETLAGLVRTAPREHLAQLRQDIVYALRMMRRTPAFTAIAILTLATGIGASTALWSIVDAVLLRPLPYAHAESLAVMWNHWADNSQAGLSNPELFDARERLRSFEVAAFTKGSANLTGGGEPERLVATHLTANGLSVLGVRPVVGRDFRAEEELAGNGRVVLLTHGLWQRRFGGSRAVLGQTLTLNGEPHSVIGVLPAGFEVPNEFGALQRSAVVLPITLDPAAPRHERGSHYLSTLARLRPGRSLTAAQAELDLLTRAFDREYPGEYNAGYRASLTPIRTEIVGPVRRPLLILFGAVLLLLLIACANVANLLLARGAARAKEIAVRQATGASPARLVRQVLTESLVLALAAAVVGIGLARAILALAAAAAPNLPRLDEAGLDLAVLAFAAGLAALTALAFGSLPALQLAGRDTAPHLHGDRGGSRTALRQGVRAALVTAQIALALVLLVGAGLLIQSFARLRQVPGGFNPDRVLTVLLSVPSSGYPEREPVVRLFERLLDGLRASPGVVGAGAVAGLPLQSGLGDWDFYLEGEIPGPHGSNRPADWQVVTPGYFETLGIRRVRGRSFSPADRADAPAVAMINETLARTIFAGRDPVGRQIRMSGEGQAWRTIVGVVADVRQDALDAPPMPEIYMPHAQFLSFRPGMIMRTLTVVVRASGDAAALTNTVRQQVRALDPGLPISTVTTMDEVVARSLAEPRLHSLLLGFFAAVALVLAVVGTYGVLAYQVTERTREIGLRQALGAKAGDIQKMVLRQGMGPALAGVAVGLGGALLLTRLLATQLFEVAPLDPTTFAATSAILLAAALLACFLPARRATGVEPSTALRAG